MRQQGIHPDTLLGNNLITIFGRLKHVDDARQVFDKMSQRDLISWNTMIAVYMFNMVKIKKHLISLSACNKKT